MECRGQSRAEKGAQKSKDPSKVSLHSMRQPDRWERDSARDAGPPGVWDSLGCRLGAAPPSPSPRIHAQAVQSVGTLLVTPSHMCMYTHVCASACVCLDACVQACVWAAIWQAILQEPCSTVAAHQNSIKQFRSRSKGCVIITSYW